MLLRAYRTSSWSISASFGSYVISSAYVTGMADTYFSESTIGLIVFLPGATFTTRPTKTTICISLSKSVKEVRKVLMKLSHKQDAFDHLPFFFGFTDITVGAFLASIAFATGLVSLFALLQPILTTCTYFEK